MKEKLMKFGPICIAVFLFLFGMWRIRFGMHGDEVYSIAVGDMIANGNSFFKECWSSLQMTSVFSAPIIYIYECIMGNRDGILLLFRVISVCIQSGICLYFYFTFKGRYGKGYVLAASILMFAFIPDFQSFNYKQELIWFAELEIIFLYRFYSQAKQCYLILFGLMIAGAVLAFPTTVLEFPIWLLLLRCLYKHETGGGQKKWFKSCMIVVLTCITCAALFLICVLRQISLSEFLIYFPKTFLDENLDTNFIVKLRHPLIKFLIMGLTTLIPVLLCEKIKFFKRILQKFPIPIVTILLLMAFLGQVYIERLGVTWHCITYPYTLTIFIVPYIYWSSREKEKILIYIFEIPAIMTVLCIALASNQGNITSMYGTIFSAVGLMLILGDKEIDKGIICKEKKQIAVCLCICALSMYIIPVWEQDGMFEVGARTIFTERWMVQYGPAKGIALGEESYKEYNDICAAVDENVAEEDLLFIIDNGHNMSYGYLDSVGGYATYSTYSPQGGNKEWLARSQRDVEYFQENPQKMPTVVLIRLEFIEQAIDEYLENAPVGVYLRENGFNIIGETAGYVVMRNES